MPAINYDGRIFHAIANSENGEVSAATVFHYHQDGDLFWSEYGGGEIRKGSMIGLVHQDGSLEFVYHHLNTHGVLRTGKCSSTPEILHNGKIRLHENWRWNDGSREEGTSTVEEVTDTTVAFENNPAQ